MDTWLSLETRKGTSTAIELIDVQETMAPDAAVLEQLSRMVLDSCLGIEFYDRAAAILDWQILQDIRQGAIPTLDRMTRGVFGESLASYTLEKHHGYAIPVKKTRYRYGPNASPTGTDIIALICDGTGQVQQLCYVECKLRTTMSDARDVVMHAQEQLKKDRDTRTPAMVAWISRVLCDRGDPLHAGILDYLRDRRERDIDAFRIVLVWDAALWDEVILSDILVEPDPMSRLSIHIVQLADLRSLVENTYRAINVTADDDDD